MGTNDDPPRGANTTAVLRRVEELLAQGEPRLALAALDGARRGSRLVENARGVCLMRLGRTREASELYQRTMLAPGSLELVSGLPLVFVTNYATALLLENNVVGCLALLREVRGEEHPSVQRLRRAIEAWKGRLSRWARLQFWMYGTVTGSVPLDFPPGELLLLEPDAPIRAA